MCRHGVSTVEPRCSDCFSRTPNTIEGGLYSPSSQIGVPNVFLLVCVAVACFRTSFLRDLCRTYIYSGYVFYVVEIFIRDMIYTMSLSIIS